MGRAPPWWQLWQTDLYHRNLADQESHCVCHHHQCILDQHNTQYCILSCPCTPKNASFCTGFFLNRHALTVLSMLVILPHGTLSESSLSDSISLKFCLWFVMVSNVLTMVKPVMREHLWGCVNCIVCELNCTFTVWCTCVAIIEILFCHSVVYV